MTDKAGALKALFDNIDPATSAWLASPDPFTQEAFLRAGFDLVTFDMQHGLIDKSDVRDGITRAYGFAKPAIVRVPVGDPGLASWVLDMGASGVVMPMIESADEARDFVKHVKYPPLGLRSYGPIRAAPLAKEGDTAAYVASANAETYAFGMIETRNAMDALDEIAAIEGLDGLFVGPADLSIALSDDAKPDLDGTRLNDAMKRIVKACQKNGKVAACYAPTPDQALRYASLGCDVLFGDHRIVELVVLVVELDDRARQHGAFLDAEALGERAGRDVAHDNLERHDLDFLDQLLAHVEPLNEVGRDAHLVQMTENVFGNPVVEDALAVDDLVLLVVEGGCVVLEELDESAGLGAFVKDLALAFVDAATTCHIKLCFRLSGARAGRRLKGHDAFSVNRPSRSPSQ